MQVIIYVKKIFLYNYGHIIRCRSCRRVFQLSYTCEARKPGVKEHIVDMAFDGADVRDTAKMLKIGINTVICTS